MQKTSVLLAVRHLAIMDGIRGLLETMFDSVVMVSDEVSLLKTLARLDPDLAVVDLSLDVTRESDVAVLLNKYDPELKFIVLSAHEGSEIMEKIMSSGASAYVLKRSAGRDLGKAVDEVLKGGTFISPKAVECLKAEEPNLMNHDKNKKDR